MNSYYFRRFICNFIRSRLEFYSLQASLMFHINAISLMFFLLLTISFGRTIVADTRRDESVSFIVDGSPLLTEIPMNSALVDRTVSIKVKKTKAHLESQLHELYVYILFIQGILSSQTLDAGTLAVIEATFPRYALINLISAKVIHEIEETMWRIRFTTAQVVGSEVTHSQVSSLAKCWLKLANSLSTLTEHCQKLVELQSKLYDQLDEIVDVLALLPSEYPNVYTILKDAISLRVVHTTQLNSDLEAAVVELRRQAELASELLIDEL